VIFGGFAVVIFVAIFMIFCLRRYLSPAIQFRSTGDVVSCKVSFKSQRYACDAIFAILLCAVFECFLHQNTTSVNATEANYELLLNVVPDNKTYTFTVKSKYLIFATGYSSMQKTKFWT
jgi:hypothetical protein